MIYKLAKFLSGESVYVPIIYEKHEDESGKLTDSVEKISFSLKNLSLEEFSYVQVAQYLFSTFGNSIDAEIISSDFKGNHQDIYFVVIRSDVRPRLLMTDGSNLRLVKISDIINIYPFKISLDCFIGDFRIYARNIIVAQLQGVYDFFDDKILTHNVQ